MHNFIFFFRYACSCIRQAMMHKVVQKREDKIHAGFRKLMINKALNQRGVIEQHQILLQTKDKTR